MCIRKLSLPCSTLWYFFLQIFFCSCKVSSAVPVHPITLTPLEQYGRHFADDIFRRIFMNEKFYILIKISLKFVPRGPIDNYPALVQMMAWREIGDKPLSEPMLTQSADAYMRQSGEIG